MYSSCELLGNNGSIILSVGEQNHLNTTRVTFPIGNFAVSNIRVCWSRVYVLAHTHPHHIAIKYAFKS